jgi:TolA-binding protein
VVDFSAESGYVLVVSCQEHCVVKQNQPRFPVSSTIKLSQTVAVLAILALSGCSIGDYLASYFNTYYNAQRLFDEAEDEVLRQARTPQTPDTTFLPPFVVSSSAKTKFNSVIEKCSKLLQYHPNSSLVVDAILVIGKSYYYMNENEKAERKFLELIEAFPNSSLAFEARKLLGYSYYRMNDRAKALAVGRELRGFAERAGRTGILADVSLLLGQLEFEGGNFNTAKEHYEIAALNGRTASVRAGAYMKSAEMEMRQQEYRRAFESYRKAESASADYVGEYRARLGQARMLSKLELHDESIDILEELAANTNYREFFGEIHYEIGNVYRDMDDLDAALDQYRYVDTTYARTEHSSKANYERGLIYELQLMLYDSARVAYGKARTGIPPSPYATMVNQRGENMNRYFQLTSEIIRNDSIRAALLAPPPPDTSTVADSAAVDTSLAVFEQDTMNAFREKQVRAALFDTTGVRLANAKTELASLFYVFLGIPDSAEYWYRRVLADHPGSRHEPRALFILAQILQQEPGHQGTVDSLRREVVDKYPESEFAIEARKLLGLPPVQREVDPAEIRYQHAEQLFLDGHGAAAIDSMRTIVRQYPESPYAARAQYAIGWIYEQVKTRPDSAINNYQRLVNNYPASPYVAAVRPKLAEVEALRKAKEKAVADSLARIAEPDEKTPEEEQPMQGLEDERRRMKESAQQPPKPVTGGEKEAPPPPDPKENPEP